MRDARRISDDLEQNATDPANAKKYPGEFSRKDGANYVCTVAEHSESRDDAQEQEPDTNEIGYEHVTEWMLEHVTTVVPWDTPARGSLLANSVRPSGPARKAFVIWTRPPRRPASAIMFVQQPYDTWVRGVGLARKTFMLG